MEYLERFDLAAGRLTGVLASGDLAAPVPACPGWTLADLGAHVGAIHQWAEHAVTERNPDARPTSAPDTQPGLADWYRQSAESLSATLRSTGPDQEAWHFGPKPRTAGFWHRRQAHEATMHLTDALASQGETPQLADEAFAADGLDEVADMFLPRQQRLGRLTGTPHRLTLRAGENAWTFGGQGGSEVTVHGPASTLLLLVWNRIGLDDPRLTVTGDEAAARAVLDSGLVP